VGEPLDIAIAGTRGAPARYGGFETFAEELGAGLAARGHRVTVYGREPYVGTEARVHRGIRVVPVAAPRGKHLETPLHTLATAVRAFGARHDVVLLCNAANAVLAPLFRLSGARVVLNVDGVERMRRKWGVAGRLWYSLGERLALRLSDQPVADADVIASYYRSRHGRELPVIPYGGDRAATGDAGGPCDSWLDAWGVTRGRYGLVVGRLEPENNALFVVEAWRAVRADWPLVVVGDAPYAAAYKARLRAAAARDERVVLAGGVYGEPYLQLQAHAGVYVAAGEVGGTHPALVEAMSAGGPVVANDVPEHREVLGDAGRYYGDAAALGAAVDLLAADPALARELTQRARARAAARYRWDAVTVAFVALLRSVVAPSRASAPFSA
jgi:glycosyltransferase involved in cell wall biosynthesis